MEHSDPLRGDAGVRTARAALFAMLCLTPVVFWRGGLEPFELCKVAIVQLSALALLMNVGLLACTWMGQARREFASLGQRMADLTADPVSRIMLLGAIAGLVVTLNSISPLTSWQGGYENAMGLETTLALLIVFFAMRAVVRDAADIRLFVVAVAIALVPVTLYALVQIVGCDPFEWDQTSPFLGWTRPIGTLGHPNYLAGYLVMALPLVVWLTIQYARERRRGISVALALLVFLGSVVVVASLSRSAWLAGGLAAVLVAIIQVARAVSAYSIARRASKGGKNSIDQCASAEQDPCLRVGLCRLIILALVLTVGVITAATGLPAPLRERIRHVAAMDARWPIWNGAWRIFSAHPVTGCGLDTFDLAFRRQGLADYWRIEWGIIPTRAHNDLLHTLATQGLLGGGAFLLMAGALVWAAFRAWRLGRAEDRSLVLALAAAVLAWYVQNSFGFPVAPTASLFVVLAAWLSRLAWPGAALPRHAGAEEKSHAPRPGLIALRAAIMVAGMTSAWQLVARPYLAGCECHQGTDLLSAEPDRALACQESAVRLDPRRDMLWIELCRSARVAADQRGVPEERRSLLKRALEAIDEACRLVPESGQNLAIRARILHVLAGDGLARPEEVLAAFDEAARLDPDNAVLLGEAAGAAIGLGLGDRSFDYLDRGARLDPSLGVFKMNRAALALAGNRYTEAEALLGEALKEQWHADIEGFDRARLLLSWTYLNTGRSEQALRMIDESLRQNDQSWPAHSLRAKTLEKLGRRQEALGEYRRIAKLRPDHADTRAALTRLEGTQ